MNQNHMVESSGFTAAEAKSSKSNSSTAQGTLKVIGWDDSTPLCNFFNIHLTSCQPQSSDWLLEFNAPSTAVCVAVSHSSTSPMMILGCKDGTLILVSANYFAMKSSISKITRIPFVCDPM
jgi:hypothetical protein